MKSAPINIHEIDLQMQKQLPDLVPGDKNYMVVNAEGKTIVLNEKGGLNTFGEDEWELIVEGIHPDGFIIKELTFTLN